MYMKFLRRDMLEKIVKRIVKLFFGTGVITLFIGGASLDSYDMRIPVLLCVIGVCLIVVTIPFIAHWEK